MRRISVTTAQMELLRTLRNQCIPRSKAITPTVSLSEKSSASTASSAGRVHRVVETGYSGSGPSCRAEPQLGDGQVVLQIDVDGPLRAGCGNQVEGGSQGRPCFSQRYAARQVFRGGRVRSYIAPDSRLLLHRPSVGLDRPGSVFLGSVFLVCNNPLQIGGQFHLEPHGPLICREHPDWPPTGW